MNNAKSQNRLTVLSAVTVPGGIPTRRVLCVDTNGHDPADDAQLLERYKQSGCQDAFERLVDRHAGWVEGLVRRKIKDRHLAEDVTQAVFIILARKARTIRPNVVLSAWLFRVARYAARDALKQELRRNRRWQRVAEMRAAEVQDIEGVSHRMRNAGPTPSTALADADLDDAIACLSESDRQVILLRFYEDKTMAEIGIALGIAEVAAKQRVSRALKRLRALMARRGVTIGSLGFLATLLRGAGTTKGISITGSATVHSMSLAAVGRGEASGQSLRVAQSTLRSIASAQCRLWAAMSSAAMAFIIAIAMLSPVMGQAALGPLLHRAGSAVSQLFSDLPRVSGFIFAPKPSQAVPLTKVWVGNANQGGRSVLPPDAAKTVLPMRSISGANEPVAVAQDAKGQYWYHRIEPPAGSTSLVSHLRDALDIDVDRELTALAAKSESAQRDPLEHSLDYFHAALISQAVQAADWRPLDPPGRDGGVVLPFSGTNGGPGNIDTRLQTVNVPEPLEASIVATVAFLFLCKRRRA